jgi:pyruvate dehydrogenase E1 component alpha subunit
MEIPKKVLLEMYRRMVRIRKFEETTIDLFKRGMIKGAVHPYIGQEASGVGVCMALRDDDFVTGTHRSHGHTLAKGGNARAMMAEVKGKVTGCCKGRGGSMHVADLNVSCLGALAIVGAGIPMAVGAALAFKMQGKDNVAAPFFGDGGCNTGNFHEGLNMASIWKLPVIFALENNRWAVSTCVDYSSNVQDLSLRAVGYGIPGVRVDGNDAFAVYEATAAAVARARRGEGPTLLVTETYRVEGHYAGEPQVYRDRSEVEPWRSREKDPIWRFRDNPINASKERQKELDAIDAEIAAEMEEAVKFALESPEPDPATCLDYIYV